MKSFEFLKKFNQLFFKSGNAQKGSSLAEVLVAMGISGMMSVAIMQMSENSQKSMTKIDTDASLRLFLNGQLRPLLARTDSCLVNFSAPNVADVNVDTPITKLFLRENVNNVDRVVFTSDPPTQDMWDATNPRQFIAGNSWSIKSMMFRKFSSTNNLSDLTLGKCGLDITVVREKRTASGKMFSFGPQEKTITIDLFCKTQAADPTQLEICNAISTDDNDLWTKKEITTTQWRTFINHNNTNDDHVVIGHPDPSQDFPLGTEPLAPLTIYENERSWYFPVFKTGVNLPKDSVYAWRLDSPPGSNIADWGISELGDFNSSCINYLSMSTADAAVFPVVKHCRDDVTTTLVNEDISYFKNTIQIEDGNLDLIYGNIIVGSTIQGRVQINSITFPNHPRTSPSGVANSVLIGSASRLNYSNSTILGVGSRAAKDENGELLSTSAEVSNSMHIIGRDNKVFGKDAFVVGDKNYIQSSLGCYILGFHNSTTSCQDSTIVGERNSLNGRYQHILGSYNSTGTQAAVENFIVGYNNVIQDTNAGGNFLTGRNNYLTPAFSKVKLFSANGVGVNDTSSFPAESSGELAFHAENGHRFFVGSTPTEVMRIQPNGSFIHGNLSYTFNMQNQPTSTAISARDGTIDQPYSVMFGSTASILGNGNPNISGFSAIMGSANVNLVSKMATGVFFSKQVDIMHDQSLNVNNYGYGEVVIGSSAVNFINTRGNNAVVGSYQALIEQAPPGDNSNAPINNGIVGSRFVQLRSLTPNGSYSYVQDNFIGGSEAIILQAMDPGTSSVPRGIERNAIISAQSLNGQEMFENFVLASRATTMKYAGANCVIAANGVTIDGIAAGPGSTTAAYGNTIIGGTYSSSTYDGINIVDNSSFNLIVQGRGYTIGDDTATQTPIYGTVTLTDGKGWRKHAYKGTSGVNNRMVTSFYGGYEFFTRSASVKFSTDYAAIPDRGVNLMSSSWGTISDKNQKENFVEVMNEDFIKKYLDIPIERWAWKDQDQSKQHISPYAEDFQSAFGTKYTSDDKIEYFRLGGINMKMAELSSKRTLVQEEKTISIWQRVLAIVDELKALIESLQKLITELNSDQEDIDNLEKQLISQNKMTRKNEE